MGTRTATAAALMADGVAPFPVARRSVAAKHLLSVVDLDFFESNRNAGPGSYNDYRDFRTDHGITWSPDRYRYEAILEMAQSNERWLDQEATFPPDPPARKAPAAAEPPQSAPDAPEEPPPEEEEAEQVGRSEGPLALQFKRRMKTA